MRRSLRPESDVFRSTDGFPNEWLKWDNGTTELFATIDESFHDSGDYIKVPSNTTDDSSVVFKLSTVPTPVLRSEHKLTVWAYWPVLGNGTTTLIVQLREGYVDESNPGTLLHADVPTLTTSLRQFDFNFDGSSIVDYSNLYVRLICVVDVVPGGDGLIVSMLNYTVPGDGILGPTGMPQFPVRPIWGQVRTTGTVNGEPLCQLLNPPASPVKLAVYELWLWGGGPDGNVGLNRQWANAVKRNEFPFLVGLGGVTTTGLKFHLDEQDTGTIHGVMQAFDFTNAQFHNAVGQMGYEFEDIDDEDANGVKDIFCQWLARPSLSIADIPTIIRPKGGFPWCVMPGSALEAVWLDNGLGQEIRLGAVWDEISL